MGNSITAKFREVKMKVILNRGNNLISMTIKSNHLCTDRVQFQVNMEHHLRGSEKDNGSETFAG
jgi:hypothetical protein